MSRKTEVVVNVTESHIKRGTEFSDSCPIALALISKKYTGVHVSGFGSLTFVNRSGRSVSIDLPSKANTFVNRFDSGSKVKPFSFKFSY